MNRPSCELSQIIDRYGERFVLKHAPLQRQRNILQKLKECRTSVLGGHVDACEGCGAIRVSYNSCRDRHCPKCQATNRERWIDARENDLLAATYFHVVFTVPEALNPLFLCNPEILYNALFEAVKTTLETFAFDPKHLGAQGGHIAVLHTWGQNIALHPHLHCIVPGGGINPQGKWKHARNKGKYLFPVKALSIVFRANFMRIVSKTRGISFDDNLKKYLYHTPWVVYAKQPFLGPKQVIEYLGRYSHKVAISNHRLKCIDGGEVSFSYKDYRHGGAQKEMKLPADEFLRRFCQHILPFRFVKIRHYGILASRNKEKMREVQFSMGIVAFKKDKTPWQQISREKLGFDPNVCPYCKGRMVTISTFGQRAPPAFIAHVPTGGNYIS